MNRYLSTLLIPVFISACGSGNDVQHHDNQKNAMNGSDSTKIAEVTVMQLQPTVFNHEIVSNGHVTAGEKVDVYFLSQGIIESIAVSNGQRVTKGERIASLDTYKLVNQLDKDRNTLATATLEMQDVLIGQGYDPSAPDRIPEETLELARLRSGQRQAELQLEATKRELQEATLTAPISGVVANLTAKPHNSASISEPLCRIINDRGMDVEFSVIESELPMVKPGDKIAVTPFSSTQSYTGHVTEINPAVDENGMVRIWASIDGGKGLIDGMNVRVNVKRAVEKALVIPKSAVVLRSGRQVVFTLDGSRALWNYVTTGLENLNEYTVVDGLTPGMTVITSGNVNLAHEAPVKVIGK